MLVNELIVSSSEYKLSNCRNSFYEYIFVSLIYLRIDRQTNFDRQISSISTNWNQMYEELSPGCCKAT